MRLTYYDPKKKLNESNYEDISQEEYDDAQYFTKSVVATVTTQ